MKLITLLLLTSCAGNNLRTWHETKEYTEVGVKCAQEYYYSFKSGHCIYIPSPEARKAPFLAVSTQRQVNVPKKIKRLKTAKFDCSQLYTKLNKCSAVE